MSSKYSESGWKKRVNSEQEPFSYSLPQHLIAQRPVKPYDRARLLVCDRALSKVSNRLFLDLPEMLNERHFLVFNNSKVMPARLLGEIRGSSARVELLLLEKHSPGVWSAIGKPFRRLSQGVEVVVNGEYPVLVQSADGKALTVDFKSCPISAEQLMERVGHMPIPPYIRKGLSDESDKHDYQAQFARDEGSIAAPTAGLHFTEELLGRIRAAGSKVGFVTLHVGRASFQSVVVGDGEITAPGEERYVYDSELLSELDDFRSSGGKIIAVGTTVVRALESMRAVPVQKKGTVLRTSIFIRPP
ncbi:MAG: S-adenosylmethionine:tRNA ribosyltransferase-isomerase, partial [Deltaproteobacteria bacterium]|nr:S-adenosylmethionine:tRNA ribosyltransferase-isomerase [Deltaproteobacteria bacterium]